MQQALPRQFNPVAADRQHPVTLMAEPFVAPFFEDFDAEFAAEITGIKVAALELENARRDKKIGKSLEARLLLKGDSVKEIEQLGWDTPLLEEFFIVSGLSLSRNGGGSERVAVVEPAEGQKCPRCWRVTPTIGKNQKHPQICERCATMVEQLKP